MDFNGANCEGSFEGVIARNAANGSEVGIAKPFGDGCWVRGRHRTARGFGHGGIE